MSQWVASRCWRFPSKRKKEAFDAIQQMRITAEWKRLVGNIIEWCTACAIAPATTKEGEEVEGEEEEEEEEEDDEDDSKYNI